MKRLSPRQLNIIVAALLATTMTVVASSAMADPTDDAASQGLNIVDSRGNSIDKYSLSLDTGSAWNPTDSKRLMAPLAEMVWGGYLQSMRILIFIFHYILTAKWLETLIAPLRGLTSGVEVIVSTLGLYPLMCTLLAASVGFALFKGHTARGFANLGVGVLIAALSIGILAHPADKVLGDGGLISQAQSASNEVNNEFFPGENPDSMTAQLVDTLVRSPHQLINYGQPVDGTSCEQVYDDSLGTDNAWEKVGGCNADMKKAAQQASGQMIARMLALLGPVYLGFNLYSYGIIAVLMFVAISAAWSGLSLTWNMVLGIASGGGRRSLLKASASLLTSLGAIVAVQVFVTGWMELTNTVLGSQIDIPTEIRFPLAGIALLLGPGVGMVFYLKARKRAKAAAARLAEATGSSAGQPADTGRFARTASNLARDAVHIGASLGGRGSKVPTGTSAVTTPSAPRAVSVPSTVRSPGRASASRATAALPSAGAGMPALSGGKGDSGAPALPAGPSGPRPGGGSASKEFASASREIVPVRGGRGASRPSSVTAESTVRRVDGKSRGGMSPETRARALRAAVTVGELGLAAATGGTSAVVSAAARQVASGVLSAGVSKTIESGKPRTPARPASADVSPTVPKPTTQQAPRRAEQLRARLNQNRVPRMEKVPGGVVDRSTGQQFRTIRVGDTEFLEPRRVS
ncbi:MAG: hypothetical protein Q4D96_10100 [Propionibacteriaceae bacterium]|nr:hypothetical protein [Propionibacteriaceae bacterium]